MRIRMFESQEVYAPSVQEIEGMPIFQALADHAEILQKRFFPGGYRLSGRPRTRAIPMTRGGGYEIQKESGGYPYYLNPTSNTLRYGALKPEALNVDLDLTTPLGWEDAVTRCFFYEFAHSNGFSAPIAMKLKEGDPKTWLSVCKKMGMSGNWREVSQEIAREDGSLGRAKAIFWNLKSTAQMLQVAYEALLPDVSLPEAVADIRKLNVGQESYQVACCAELGILDPHGNLREV